MGPPTVKYKLNNFDTSLFSKDYMEMFAQNHYCPSCVMVHFCYVTFCLTVRYRHGTSCVTVQYRHGISCVTVQYRHGTSCRTVLYRHLITTFYYLAFIITWLDRNLMFWPLKNLNISKISKVIPNDLL